MSKTKNKTQYVCSDCGNESPRWMGQCTKCKEWNTIVEFKPAAVTNAAGKKLNMGAQGGYAGAGLKTSVRLSEVDDKNVERIISGIGELDRVMGGGTAVGSANLISGDPGAGKTTLLSALAAIMSHKMNTLYATAEENVAQYRNRSIKRLKLDHNDAQFRLLNSSSLETIMEEATLHKIKFMIVDSIQAVVSPEFTGTHGSISQVKGCATALTQFAKDNDITMFIVGHVNKGNEVAGPKTLTHVVDSLMHIETNDANLRTIRPEKNRFGDVDTVGLFNMHERGMISVDNPSKLFLSSYTDPTPGSAITCIRDGNRQLMLEVQALVTETEGEHPQKTVIGLSFNRLKMITAILRKHGGAKFHHDTFANLVGGLRLPETDTSADLALAAALFSSLKELTIPRDTCFLGELSLSGEVRPISAGVPRVKEAMKLGFKTIIIPKANFHNSMLSDDKTVRVISVTHIREALAHIA
jgi:DNA repair protein RadA/Sms